MRASWRPQASSPASGNIGSAAERGKRGAASAAAPNRATRRGGKRRNQGEKKDKELQTKDKGLRELLLLLLKQVLNNTQKVRMIEGAMLDTFIFPKNHKVMMAIQEEQEAFAERVDQFRKDKDKNPDAPPLGPPHTMLFGALLDVLADTPAVGGSNQEKIKSLREDFNTCEKAEDAEQLIRVCRITKTAQEDQMKLILGIQTLGDRRFSLLDGLRQLGGRHLRGAAPLGYMEEELQDWTEWIESHLQ